MARSARAAASTAQKRDVPRRAAARVKTELQTELPQSPHVKAEPQSPPRAAAPRKRAAHRAEANGEAPKRARLIEDDRETARARSASNKSSPSDLRDRKLKAYAQYANSSPFPDFAHPTPEECKLAHRILASLHGEHRRPEAPAGPSSRAGCGDSPSVLDALVRTVLSQNTSEANSTRASQGMDRAYGRSDDWEAVVAGGRARLQEAIRCGGLSAVKSRVILGILEQVRGRHGGYSLDHLHGAPGADAMAELLGFRGVGPKTASCVLLFCLGRESFAVDTHVHRITGLLGWRPPRATRDEAHQHLDARIPDEDKYGLHLLLVTHGRQCEECRAGGKNLGRCELRRAFRRGKLAGEAGEDVREEEKREVKAEDEP